MAPTVLKFTLSPQSTQKIHDALVCLSKFNETVALDARPDVLQLSTLNSTKSAFGAVNLAASRFFDEYTCVPAIGDSFPCKLPVKVRPRAARARALLTRGRSRC